MHAYLPFECEIKAAAEDCAHFAFAAAERFARGAPGDVSR